jgi:hypothetical protein
VASSSNGVQSGVKPVVVMKKSRMGKLHTLPVISVIHF